VKGDFLPVSREDMVSRGWYWYDFLLVTGDAYVDHPSFGTPLIGRVLEAMGFRVALLAQPDWHDCTDFADMGRPRYAAMVSAGNLDSMVARYTAAKKVRHDDFYSPGKKAGLRPDRACIVYCNRLREAFPGGLPVIVGGLEASLRRFAHYDYWEDSVRRSELFDCGADLLVYGMGERATREIAAALRGGTPISEIKNVRGTARIAKENDCGFDFVECPSWEEVRSDKKAFALAAKIQYDEHDAVSGKAVVQRCGDRLLIVNPPAAPLDSASLDEVAELPFTREPHPMYADKGGVPAIEEVRFSIIHNRGCFGACCFCSLAFHQGRTVTSRSHQSVLREAEKMTRHPEFKGYISDVGGPTANFSHPSCEKQLENGMCRGRACLFPKPCPNLDADQTEYLKLLRKLRALPGIKKVFVRSGIRYDYLMCDESGELFAELVKHHISGQIKIAPEHCAPAVLGRMGKPDIGVFERFMEKYRRLSGRYGKEQYAVPYLMSSHPGSTLQDAVELAEYLNRHGIKPMQVQDFYPTPGTLSTCMYYTGIDPRDMSEVYVPRSRREKELQRALLQWYRPENRALVIEALKKAGRTDLIGFGKHCLARPDRGSGRYEKKHTGGRKK